MDIEMKSMCGTCCKASVCMVRDLYESDVQRLKECVASSIHTKVSIKCDEHMTVQLLRK